MGWWYLLLIRLVLLSKAPLTPMEVRSWLIPALELIASFVIMLMVPPIADAPNNAEPPPRTTSTRSIIEDGICSRPYTPASAENTGLESMRTCE